MNAHTLRTAVAGFSLCLAPLVASAAITVNFYTGSDNLPQTVSAGHISLDNVTGLSPGYAAIKNVDHVEFGGESTIGFMRFMYGDELCGYFYRASNRGDEDPQFSDFVGIETWQSVNWQGFGNGTLVDGAQWGSDNYILMRDASNTMVAVLQFNFDEATGTAALIASAIDLGGLTFTQGVTAIETAAIPEPSAFGALAGVGVLGAALLRRRRR